MSHNLVTIRETSFEKGYDDTKAPEHLTNGYLADAQNCFVRSDEITKRKGYTIVGTDLGANACQGGIGVRFADGTKEIIAVFNGSIYKSTGGNFSLITGGSGVLNTTAYVDIVVANNAVYFFDGVSTVPKYNATSISTVAAIPIGSFARWFHNILFVAGISATPNSVRLSDLGDPENFSTGIATTIAINPNDGDYITAFGELNAELLIFKTMRVWSLTGFGTASLTVANLNDRLSNVGTTAQRSVVNIGNDVLYMGFLGDKPNIRSIQRTRFGTLVDGGIVSDAIESSLDGVNKAALTKVAAHYDGRNVRFAVPYASSTFNNRVYRMDTLTEGWVRDTGIQASVFFSFAVSNTVQLYFGEASADSKVYVFDTATSDNGTAIDFSVTSRRYGQGIPEAKKKFKYFYVTVDESGNYDVTVEYSKDGFSFDSLGTVNMSGTGAVFDNIILDTSKIGSSDVKRKRFNLPKDVAYYNQFKLSDSSATSSIMIRDWETLLMPKSIREI